MSETPVIFFSYAWGDNTEVGESREKIVDELYQSLLEDGYLIKRDKIDMGYKGQISEFMKDIGKASCIVMVISDKYLKSPNCMFELLEIYRKSNSDLVKMKEKIFPIVLDDAKIFDPIDRLEYVEFWKRKKENLDAKIAEIGIEYAADVVDDFKIFREITSNVGLLASLLKDLNTLNPKELSNNNFAAIKSEIRKLVTSNSNKVRETGMAKQLYKLSNFRKFLEKALLDAELNSLTMEYFEPVYNKFTDGMNKLIKINLLLDYCKRNDRLGELLEKMEEVNQVQFENYKPYNEE